MPASAALRLAKDIQQIEKAAYWLSQQRTFGLLRLAPLTGARRDVNVTYIHTQDPPCLLQQSSMSSESQPGSC
jgi:hypothetical protein